MCLEPHRIVNPSTWFDPFGAQLLFIDVPCGHCSECIVSYRNEWRNRAYYETLDCFVNGGYVLFDTLTYRNGNLPHLSDWLDVPKNLDFPCFSHYHIQLFLNLLRTRLTRLGYDVSNKLRFFVACEYGDDIRYTRRPHYHVLFFVPQIIPPKVFSKAVSSAWIHGRTDGVPYRNLNYVLSNNVFLSLSESQRFSVNYVTKYCTKQFSFNRMVENRLNRLLRYDFDTWLAAKSYICCTHWQSKSFGHDALIRFVGLDTLLNEGRFRIMQRNGIFRYVNLHKSLQRKLLYDYFRDENGCVHFRLNENGFRYKKKFYYRQVDYLLNRIAALDVANYDKLKQQVYDFFFVDNRFKKFDSPEEVIDHSYNIDHGLRNYSSVDYSFLRKRVFTAKDYGSKKLGFDCCNTLKEVCRLPDSDSNEYLSLHVLSGYLNHCDVSSVDRYLASKVVNGDGNLKVMKLTHRLEHIFKCYDENFI